MTDIRTFRDSLIRPISADNPAGERLLDDSLFDFVDGQMMKVGSLSHAEVQWSETEQACIRLLSEKTKDLVLISHLLLCLQHQATPERLTLSVQVFGDFMQHFWELCHPAPGPRGVLPRRKYFSQITQRILSAVERINPDLFDSEQKKGLEDALAELMQTAEDKELPDDVLVQIRAAIRRKLASVEASQAEGIAGGAGTSAASSGAMAQTSVSTSVTSAPSRTETRSPQLDIDGSSDRATRQTLLKVADFIADLPQGMAMAARLRRFAIWNMITSPPEASAQGETALMPVSQDRIQEYEDHLNRSADLALWRRVEQSLTVAPYWLDGHFLSFRIAGKLGHPECASGIREETAGFVSRMPELLELSFKGNVPFASADTAQWLRQQEGQSGSQGGSSDWQGRREEMFRLADEGGLSVALTALNDGLKKAAEPRDCFYWRMLSCDLMHQHQLEAVAGQQYQTLLQEARTMALSDWEPSLMKKLEQSV